MMGYDVFAWIQNRLQCSKLDLWCSELQLKRLWWWWWWSSFISRWNSSCTTHWTLFKGFCASCLLSDDGLNKQTRCSRARTLKLAVFLLFCLIVLFYASFFSSKLLRTRTAVSEIGGKLHAWTPFSRNCWYFQKVPTVRSVLLWFWGEGFGSVNSGLPLRQARQMDPLSTKDFN